MKAAQTIEVGGNIDRGLPREHITTRLRQALDRLPVRPVTARVRFSDVNGPKGGDDIRCALLVELPRQPAIRVEHAATTPRLAFDATCDRLVRRLERARERWQNERRHPKKYYAANRLL